MITCNRCGNVAPAGAVHCQRCGAPLPGKVENTYNQGQQAGQSGQTGLPAWLESLRVGERSPAPAKSPSSFSASDLIEEGSLPGWMRPEQNGGSQPVPSSPPPALRPASSPGPDTDETTLAAKGFSARSLIDEQSLPSWMKEGSSNSDAPETSAPGNIAASGLVQQDSLPDWMRNLQPPSAPAPNSRASQPPSSGYPGASGPSTSGSFPAPPIPPASPVPPSQPRRPAQAEPIAPSSQGFSARDLIDQNSLPTWMTPQGGTGTDATVNKTAGTPAVPPVQTNIPASPQPQAGFSASSLLDQDALPPWLREKGTDTGASASTANEASGNNPPAQAGFSASSLLDQDALPPWLREADQQQKKGPGYSAPSQPLPVGQQGVPSNTPANATGNGIAASSFIDMNSLPEWLRESQQQGPAGTPPRSGVYGGPTRGERVENIRVPSRPRGDINPPEGSEVAANVFASMLGVASATPNFPASTPPSSPAAQMPAAAQPAWPPSSPAQPGISPSASKPLSPSVPPQQGVGSMPAIPPSGGGNQQAPQGYLGVYGGAPYSGSQNNPNSYAMGNPPVGSPQSPAIGPGNVPSPGAAGRTGDERSAMKPAKRGLFDAIRDWFFR